MDYKTFNFILVLIIVIFLFILLPMQAYYMFSKLKTCNFSEIYHFMELEK